MADHPTAASTPTTRRTIITGAAVVGAGAVLAACGGETDAAERLPARVTEAPPSGTGTPVGSASSVPVGGGIHAADAKVFISQPTAGDFRAFDALCTHKQCPMTKIEGTTISCMCHGSQFSAVDGSVEHGPATTPLPAVRVVEKNGSLFVQG